MVLVAEADWLWNLIKQQALPEKHQMDVARMGERFPPSRILNNPVAVQGYFDTDGDTRNFINPAKGSWFQQLMY